MLYGILITIVVVIVVVVIVAVVLSKEKKIEKYGIEADAVVTKVYARRNSDRLAGFDYFPYVGYIGDDNQKHEARLNCNFNPPIGRKMRVKYLPGKYDYVIFISQEIN